MLRRKVIWYYQVVNHPLISYEIIDIPAQTGVETIYYEQLFTINVVYHLK